MKSLYKILLLTVLVGVFYSCQKDSRPNYQYMPNMYEPVGYETYGEYDVFPGEQAAMIPAEGSIARGMSVYDYENNEEGYQAAKAELVNPLDSTMVDLKIGKELYDIYCGVCHGAKGDGQGILMKREKILGIPSYADAGRAITAGSIYHVIYYGRNTMGSYANQLNEEERWQVVAYVEKLKVDLEK
ncbi:MAG: cytochrome c [Bacteroidia bacterium]|nr:cytochrome c [Bacteroidia bacterium]NND12017.1 cytochrome c [Flavobacteriaceae bacterium]MBT8310227.1 cytochrome c [Bacteroidia bacterium]NNK26693.1 cytochrome c [Flavobacteriaceae bacterium]NNL61215.1 cytochrome c [Flavobacteriaceae bacterium]